MSRPRLASFILIPPGDPEAIPDDSFFSGRFRRIAAVNACTGGVDMGKKLKVIDVPEDHGADYDKKGNINRRLLMSLETMVQIVKKREAEQGIDK